MRVLVAPLELKGSLSAAEAARAIRHGINRARPSWDIDIQPMSDGGPGFLDSLAAHLDADLTPAPARDARGLPVHDAFVLIDRGKAAAYVESSMAIGLARVPEHERDALRASSEGAGDLLLAAANADAKRIVIGVGGSATSDGGTGMARALGARFLDGAGTDLPPGGSALKHLAAIEWTLPPALRGIAFVVATDVTSPLTGPSGAARVFGPQKGASPGEVEQLERGLERFASVLRDTYGIDVAAMPAAGAAGGLAAAMVAFLGARLTSGFEVVAEAVGLEARIAAADYVVTAEGSFDAQSLLGKGTERIRAMAATHAKPCVVFAGQTDGAPAGVHTIVGIEPRVGEAMKNAGALLEDLVKRWAEETG